VREEAVGDLSTTTLVRSEGCYLVVLDAQSSANIPGRWATFMERAHKETTVDAPERFLFNSYWLEQATAGHLQAWTVLFDGVYKIQLRLGSKASDDGADEDRFVGSQKNGILDCPSGRLLVGSLSRLGEGNWPEVMRVEPGRYRLTLTSATEQQLGHQGLESVDEYPANDRPDWTVYLAPA
jgi:hypothetical protein